MTTNMQKRETAHAAFRALPLRDRLLARLYFILTWLVPDWLVRKLINREADRGRHERRDLGHQRLGLQLPPPSGAPVIWLHAIGPGDAIAIQALSDALLQMAPTHHLVITTRAPAAYDMLRKRMDDPRITITLAPHDSYRAMVRFLDHWQPELAVFGEGDFWPNGLIQAAKRDVKVAIVNASMVGRLGNELRRSPALGRWLMTQIDYVHFYSESCQATAKAWFPKATRMAQLPNLKMASVPLPDDIKVSAALQSAWGDAPVLTFGSLASNEIAFALSVFAKAKADIPTLKAIIAPRWIRHAHDMVEACEGSAFKVVQRSRKGLPDADTDVLLADTYGEMGIWYRHGIAAYVGASLNNGAGHNPFEPAILGTHVLAASFTKGFKEDYQYLHDLGVCTVSDDANVLAHKVVAIARDPGASGGQLPPLNVLREQTTIPLARQLFTLV